MEGLVFLVKNEAGIIRTWSEVDDDDDDDDKCDCCSHCLNKQFWEVSFSLVTITGHIEWMMLIFLQLLHPHLTGKGSPCPMFIITLRSVFCYVSRCIPEQLFLCLYFITYFVCIVLTLLLVFYDQNNVNFFPAHAFNFIWYKVFQPPSAPHNLNI